MARVGEAALAASASAAFRTGSPALGVLLDAFVKHADVAAGAEAPRARLVVDENGREAWILGPALKRFAHLAAHGEIEGVKGLRLVEGDAPQRSFDRDLEPVRHG